MADVSFRVATADDAPRIMTLVREFEAHEGYRRDEAPVRAALTALLDDERGPHLGRVALAEREDRLVGYGVVTWGWSLESGGREALLDEIYVAERGHGISTGLFACLRRLSVEADARVLFLETERTNERARTWYAGLGMTVENSVWLSLDLQDPRDP